MSETLAFINDTIKKKASIHHAVVNAGKIVSMQHDKQLFKSVVNADIINADGQAVVWAAKILGKPLPERVTGIDLMENLVQLAYNNGYKIFFFGAKEEIVKKVVDVYSKRFSPRIIAGYRNGYYKPDEEGRIAAKIAESGANILFVAISFPEKENFLYKNKEILKNVNFIMGVGGSFDIVAGKIKRAPVWVRKLGLEWVYRLVQEPKRMWKRYIIGNIKFIILVIKELKNATKTQRLKETQR